MMRFCEEILEVFEKHSINGHIEWIRLPRPGANPRCIEFTKEALSNLVGDSIKDGLTYGERIENRI